MLIAVGLLVLAAVFAGTMSRPRFALVTGERLVNIDTKDMRPGSVRFFRYRDRTGDEVRFLLARDSAGQIKAAFDACERCYMYHKGYEHAGNFLVCRFCGNRYRLEAMEAGLASCVPVKLPIEVVGQTVKIKSADLEREHGLF